MARSSDIDPRLLELFDRGRVVDLNGRSVKSQLRQMPREPGLREHP